MISSTSGNEVLRLARVKRGDVAPRVEVEDDGNLQKVDILETGKTPQQRSRQKHAEKVRAEKIAAGKQADKEPLAPIEQRKSAKFFARKRASSPQVRGISESQK